MNTMEYGDYGKKEFTSGMDGRGHGIPERMFTGQIGKGDTYDKLKKCIHVSFLDFIHFENDYDFYRKITLRDEKNSEYTDLLELHIL